MYNPAPSLNNFSVEHTYVSTNVCVCENAWPMQKGSDIYNALVKRKAIFNFQIQFCDGRSYAHNELSALIVKQGYRL